MECVRDRVLGKEVDKRWGLIEFNLPRPQTVSTIMPKKISTTFSVFDSLALGRHCCWALLITVLSIIHMTDACLPGKFKVLLVRSLNLNKKE